MHGNGQFGRSLHAVVVLDPDRIKLALAQRFMVSAAAFGVRGSEHRELSQRFIAFLLILNGASNDARSLLPLTANVVRRTKTVDCD